MNKPYNHILGKDIEKLPNTKIIWWANDNALLEILGRKVAVILTFDGSNKVKSVWDYEREVAK